jgi:hypothetical protein
VSDWSEVDISSDSTSSDLESTSMDGFESSAPTGSPSRARKINPYK